MAFKYTRAYLRPDLDTQFYVTPQELIDFIKEKYVDTGLCLSFREETAIDDTGLVIEVISLWADQESSNQCKNEPLIQDDNLQRIEYNKSKRIGLVYITEDEVDL